MKLPTSILALVAMLTFSGCVTEPTFKEINAADYGPPPTGRTHQIVRDFMELRLKDPDTAQYKFADTVDKYWVKGAALSGKGTYYGWRARALINGRNSYGGYTGYQAYAFLIRDGRVIAFTENADSPQPFWQLTL